MEESTQFQSFLPGLIANISKKDQEKKVENLESEILFNIFGRAFVAEARDMVTNVRSILNKPDSELTFQDLHNALLQLKSKFN
jgi:hypothetical protein